MMTGIWSYEWALDNPLIFLTSIHITKTHYQCTGPDKPIPSGTDCFPRLI